MKVGDEIWVGGFGWCEVTNLFDEEGDELDDDAPEWPTSAVAKTPDGQWLAMTLSDVEPMKKH